MDCEIKDIVGYIVVTVILIITESLPFFKKCGGGQCHPPSPFKN